MPAISAPNATQLSADSTTAAPSAASPPRPAQASANSGTTTRASAGFPRPAGHTNQPSASAANSGTPTSAIYVSACALPSSAIPPTATKPITDTAGITAHSGLRTLASLPGDQARGNHTTTPWQRESDPIDTQNGNTQSK